MLGFAITAAQTDAFAEDAGEAIATLKFGFVAGEERRCEPWRAAAARVRIENVPAILVPGDLMVDEDHDDILTRVKVRRAGSTYNYDVRYSEFEPTPESRPVARTEPINIRRSGELSDETPVSSPKNGNLEFFDPRNPRTWLIADESVYPRGYLTLDLDVCVYRQGLERARTIKGTWSLEPFEGSDNWSISGEVTDSSFFMHEPNRLPEYGWKPARFEIGELSLSARSEDAKRDGQFVAFGQGLINTVDWNFAAEEALP